MLEPPQIAERIKGVIKAKKIGTLDMLQSCGLSKNALTTMVNGSMPKADSLAKIANYLGVSVDYLLDIEKPSTPEGEQSKFFLTENEQLLLIKLRTLDADKRKAIETLLG